MANLVVFYDKNKDILRIVNKYSEMYKANVYEIKTVSDDKSFKVRFSSTYFGNKIGIRRCNLDLKKFDNIIIISSLWFNKLPSPVISFLEQATGKVNNVIYILYNNNKDDCPKEFDKMDKILNMRRDKSYFVSLNKTDMHVRVYQ